MKVFRTIFHLDNIIATLIVFLVIEHFSLYQNLDFLNPFINTVQDLNLSDVVFSKIRNDGRYGVDSNVVLVNIGYLERDGIAKEIEIINKYEPKVLGIDSFFRTPKDEKQDSLLIESLSNVKSLVLAEKIHYNYEDEIFDSVSYSHPMFTGNAVFGFANIIEDMSGKTYKDMTEEEIEEKENTLIKSVRQVPIMESIKGRNEIFLAAKIAEFYAPDKVKKLLERGNDREIVNYRRNLDRYITLDVKDVFEGSEKLELIRDKIVLMGFLGPNLETLVHEDIFFTPMNPQFVGKTFPDMYGVVIHANVLSMILDESYFYEVPEWASEVLIIVILFTMMVGLFILRHVVEIAYEPLSIGLVFGSLVLWYAIILHLFHTWNIYLELGDLFFVILLTVPVFEAYQDSLKPIALRRWAKMNIYFKRKMIDTRKEESEDEEI